MLFIFDSIHFHSRISNYYYKIFIADADLSLNLQCLEIRNKEAQRYPSLAIDLL